MLLPRRTPRSPRRTFPGARSRRPQGLAVEALEERKVLSFAAPMNVPISGGPNAVAVGDLNGDGKNDLIAPAGSAGVSAILGKGNGTFGSRIDSFATAASGGAPWDVVLGDFNGDGKLDAVTSNLNGNVNVLLGNGDGSFRAPASTFIGFDARSVAVGDFNGDGKLDLAAVSVGSEQKSPGTKVLFMFGRGDGSFNAPAPWAVGNAPIYVTSGDFNGDGKVDVVTANYKDGTISELLGNGNGSFQGLRNFGIGTHPVSVAVRDFNGDGKLDMAVGLAGGSVNFLFGKGDGSFSTGKRVDLSQALNSIAANDFNGDGKMDVVAANNQANTVSLLLGKGDGTFQAPVNTVAGSQPWFIATGDLNGDGRADIVTANTSGSDVTVYLNQGPAVLTPALPASAVGATPLGIAQADLNGDGVPDLITANAYSNTVSVLLGAGGGSFQPAASYAVGQRPAAVTVGDFNGDGKVDLAVANSNMTTLTGFDNVSVLLGNGDGTFQPAVNYAVGSDPNAIVAADFNGDGKLDLATANFNFGSSGTGVPGQSTVSILTGNGDGTFLPAQNFQSGGDHPGSLVAADFNGDGRADLVVANTSYSSLTSGLTLLAGNGDGSFQPPVTLLAGTNAGSVVTGDFNHDGTLDLAATTSQGISVLLGSGGGSFSAPTVVSTVGSGSLAVGDLNGDGNLDLIVTNGPTVGVLTGSGTGSFSAPRFFLVGATAWAVTTGDINGDGIADLAVADSTFGGPGNILMLFNDGKPF